MKKAYDEGDKASRHSHVYRRLMEERMMEKSDGGIEVLR